jgi:hypothetical protein
MTGPAAAHSRVGTRTIPHAEPSSYPRPLSTCNERTLSSSVRVQGAGVTLSLVSGTPARPLGLQARARPDEVKRSVDGQGGSRGHGDCVPRRRRRVGPSAGFPRALIAVSSGGGRRSDLAGQPGVGRPDRWSAGVRRPAPGTRRSLRRRPSAWNASTPAPCPPDSIRIHAGEA